MSADVVTPAAESVPYSPKNSPLAVIRAHTRDQHIQLEAAIDLDAALQSLKTYRTLLQKYLVLYRAFEDVLSQKATLLASLTGYLYQSRESMLERDLASLAAPVPPKRDRPHIWPPSLPSLDHLDQILGALYVVEGSSLGGQLIYRAIQQKLNLDTTSGAAFFYGPGENTGPAWKQFTATLEQHVLDPLRAAKVATAMFQAFQSALQPDVKGSPTA